jgi:hypothetical protein
MNEQEGSSVGDPFAFGAVITREFPDRTPLSARQWWSGFDDYFAMQKVLGKHDDTTLDPSKPQNGIGATISFAYMGGQTREVLDMKDDVNFLWKISIPEANATFSYYQGTARVHAEDPEGCDVSYAIDFTLTAEDRDVRQALIETPIPKGPSRANEVSRFVLGRDGVRNSFTFPVHAPIETLWAAVGDWNSVSWVQNATGVELLPSGARRVLFAGGTEMEETPVSIDATTHTLVYEVNAPARMPVRMYHGTVHLEATGPSTTQVTYTQLFIAKDELDPQVVRKALATSFCARFAWIQQAFDTRKK